MGEWITDLRLAVAGATRSAVRRICLFGSRICVDFSRLGAGVLCPDSHLIESRMDQRSPRARISPEKSV